MTADGFRHPASPDDRREPDRLDDLPPQHRLAGLVALVVSFALWGAVVGVPLWVLWGWPW